MLKRLLFLLCSIFVYSDFSFGCTSAIIGADMNPYGRPLLWKNRDTGNPDNKIEYIPRNENDYSYVALFNSSDSLLREAWIGMNEYGFAIMNTASYNLKNDDVAVSEMDKEGLIMSNALKKCKKISDFATMLDTLPKPLGVEANFGVIDAYGDGAYFETNNYTYTPFYLSDSPDNILIRTNYSYSGRPDEGFGFIREADAIHLIEPYIQNKNITPDILTENLSKSFYHALMNKDFSILENKWVIDQDFIPRYTSTATIVIEGCKPLNKDIEINPEEIIKEYIMWSGLGYPPCAEIYPVRCSQEGVDKELRGSSVNGHSPQCDLVNKRKEIVFPFKMGNGNKYIDMSKLYNKAGNGYAQKIKTKNLETYNSIRKNQNN